MRKIRYALAVLALIASVTVTVPTAAAQSQTDSASSGPPPVVQIFREEVKPGKSPLHAKTEAAFLAAYKKSGLKYYYLGATAMTGPSEAWFLSAYSSMEDVEKANQAFEANKAVQAELDRANVADGELLTNVRSTYLFYNRDLTYRPDFNLGDYKYFMVDTVRIKPGHFEKFADLRKAVNAAHEKANVDEHMLVYNVGLGAPAGTVMVFQPLKSLKEYDDFPKTHGKGSAYYEAVGDDGRKMFNDFARDDQQFFVRDILAFSPGMSFLSEKIVAANPSYWKPKTEMVKAAAAKPAAKKEPAKTEKK